VNFEKIEKILALMSEHSLTHIEIESDNEKIVLSRQLPGTPQFIAAPSPTMMPISSVTDSSAPPQKTRDSDSDDFLRPGEILIKSPFVGTYYKAPSPDSPDFIEVGQTISKGKVLCIIEAMKIMNEIESEVSGTVKAILVENGKPIQFDTPLFIIETKG
jgi:acetyl-CoA carboxylase biotin carboxyl carrier protein